MIVSHIIQAQEEGRGWPKHGMSREWFAANALLATISAAKTQALVVGMLDLHTKLDYVFALALAEQTKIAERDHEMARAKRMQERAL